MDSIPINIYYKKYISFKPFKSHGSFNTLVHFSDSILVSSKQ